MGKPTASYVAGLLVRRRILRLRLIRGISNMYSVHIVATRMQIIFKGRVASSQGLASGHIHQLSKEIGDLPAARPFEGSLNLVFKFPVELDPQKAWVLGEDRRQFRFIRVNEIPCLGYRRANCHNTFSKLFRM